MVFEGVLASVLQSTFEKFIENFDAKHLKVGIWGGDVVLTDLILKASALNDLDLPVTTIYGHLGKCVLKIPWKNLYTAPIDVTIEKLYLLVVPNNSIRYDQEKEDKANYEAKVAEFKRIEDKKKAEAEKDKVLKDKGFMEKLITQAINNVQVKVSDIHVRYEDSTTTQTPFACGITLKNLVVHTANANWVQTLYAEALDKVYKVAQMDSLAIYMNCNTELFGPCQQSEYNQMFADNIASHTNTPEDYHYILGPISSGAKLQMNKNPELDVVPFSIPKFKLNLKMETLSVCITNRQYRDVMELVEAMGRLVRAMPYRKYRPHAIPYKGYYREWWQFAFTCILETEVRRQNIEWSWKHIKAFRDSLREYASLYELKLQPKKATPEVLKRCTELEMKIDVYNLIVIRKQVEVKMESILKKSASEESASKGWFTGWFGSKETVQQKENFKAQMGEAMTVEEKAKLFEAIGYHDTPDSTDYPDFFIDTALEFELTSLELFAKQENIASAKKGRKSRIELNNILMFQLKTIKCNLGQRPANSALKVELTMQELLVLGKEHNGSLPKMISSKLDTSNTLFSFMFESKPLDKKCDQRIAVTTHSVTIIYDAETIIQLAKMFSTPKTATLSQLQDAATAELMDIKERTATGLQYAIDSRPRLEMNVELNPSFIVVPYGGYYTDNESAIVVSLGEIIIKTEPRPMDALDVKTLYSSGRTQDEILTEMMSQSYDKFSLEIKNIQIVVPTRDESWQEVVTRSIVTEMHLLEPTTLLVSAKLSVIDDDPRLPKFKVFFELPSIHLSISEDRVAELLSIVTSIPLPESDEPLPGIQPENPDIVQSTLSLMKFIDDKQKKITGLSAPPSTTNVIDGEVVQFTNLELGFILNDITIVLVKSCVKTASTTPSDDYHTPTDELPKSGRSSSVSSRRNSHNSRSRSNSPSVKKVGFDVPLEDNRCKIVQLQIKHLEMNVVQKTFQLDVSLKLGAIAIDHYREVREKMRVIQILSTPKFDKVAGFLFSVDFTNCKKISPEFHTKYCSVENMIAIHFATFKFVLNQEGIKDLIEIATNFQYRIDIITNAANKDRVGTTYDEPTAAEQLLAAARKKLPDIVEEGDEGEGTSQKTKEVKKRSTSSIVDSVQIKLDLVLEDVSIKIQNAKRGIATIDVNNLQAGIIVKSSCNEINLKLKNVLVIDPNPNSIHSTILSVIGENALECQVVIFNIDETSDYNSDNIRISVRMGCAKIVFLNWFVTSLLNFLDNFQTAQQTIKDASAAAAEAAKQNVVEAYTQATRMKLDIRIKAPIIAIPVDSNSTEAIAVDLGNLTISNTCKNIQSPKFANQIAVLDEMVIELKDMKLSKVELISSSKHIATDVVDFSYGISEQSNMLSPTSFSLSIKRNLSTSWYKDIPGMEIQGKLFTVELNVISDDYNVIMNILSRNMKEGQSNKKPPQVRPTISTVSAGGADIENLFGDKSAPKSSGWAKTKRNVGAKGMELVNVADKLVKEQENENTVSMKFSFQIDSIILNLSTTKDESLATLALHYFSTNGTQLSDGSMSVSVVLCDIILDDKRPNRQQKLTRFMKRKVGETHDLDGKVIKCNINDRSAMIDVTVSIKKNETYVDCKILSFDLILSLDFLLKLSGFLKPSEENVAVTTSVSDTKISSKVSTSSTASLYGDKPVVEEVISTTILKLYIEKPDIILVEKMDDINCYALILNSEINMNVRLIGPKQIIQGDIQDLCLYCSEFNPDRRSQTKHFVIHPLSIYLNGSTPDDNGLHLNLISTNIKIAVSPDIIELLNNVMTTMTDIDQKQLEETNEVDYTDLWEVKTYEENDFWFIRPDESIEALETDDISDTDYKAELCIVDIPSIQLIIESGVGTNTIPMLQLESSMQAKISDWSYKMKVDSYLRLGMSYFNSTLALWEPLIEPIEKEQANGLVHYVPWELNFVMEVDQMHENDLYEKTQRITVSSAENLEVTVTKTCLDVLQNLGSAFSEAIGAEGIIKPDISSSYIIINDTGLDLKLNLKKSCFVLHNIHLFSRSLIDSVIVEKSDSNEVVSCIILPKGRAYLDAKKLGTEKVLDKNERFLYVKVDTIDKELTLPVFKADRRYFPLYRDTQQDPFSIISEVKLDMGSTVVTLHGVLKVFNHFSAPIEVHQIEKDKFITMGEVQPNSTFNIPLPYIYSVEKNIHFSIRGYKVSIQGIGWKENPSDHNLLKTLQCDPVKTYEPFYINAIRERQDVFHEVTSKYTMLSACYLVHLRPSISLRNALPIPFCISVAGCSVSRDVEDEIDASTSTLQITNSALGEDFLDYGEKVINPGNILHLPTIKLIKSSHEPKTFVVARILQYLEKDWSCNTEINLIEEEFTVWTFHSYDSSKKMSLTLGVRCEKKDNVQVMTLYSPFWMINKTGLSLSYRKSRKTEKHELAEKKLKGSDEDTNIIYHPVEYDGYILFSFREKAFFGKKKAAVRVDTGEWSEKFSLDVAGSSGVILCESNGMTYQIGVHNMLTSNSLTKQIVFMPYFVLINRASYPISVQEYQRSYDPWCKVEVDDCAPLWPKSDVSMLIAKCSDASELSPPFEYNTNQNSLLQLKNRFGGLNVDVQVTEGAVYITFTGYFDGDAPALIINNTEEALTFFERGDVNQKTLKPKEKVLYAWRDPSGEKKIVFHDFTNGKQIETDLRKDCVEGFSGSKSDDNPTYWMSFLDGTQRVLLFTQNSCIQTACEEQNTQEILLNIQGIGLSLLNNETNTDVMYIGIASSDVTWEEKKRGRFKQMKHQECVIMEQKYQEFEMDNLTDAGLNKKYYLHDSKNEIDFANLQIHKSSVRDIRRVFYPGLWFQMKTSALQVHFHAKINRIQIDNQLTDCIFPVVLAPVPLPKSISATTELKPFIEMSVVQRVIPHSTVKQFQYLRVLIQEFHVKVDLGFINQIVQFLNTETSEEEAKKLFGKDLAIQIEPLLERVNLYSRQEQKNFYDNLHLGPLKIHVSFSLSGSETKALPGILSTILQGVGVTLTDVNDVVFRLAYFEREYQFFTKSQVVSQCVSHYAGQFVKQLYVLVLGLDVIGNPFGLVVGLTKGVEDFFYEPFQGAIQGPGEFAEGLVLGVRSLFGHTVGGAAGAVSKITGAMGKGIAALTFDKDYQKQRQDNLNKTPANLREGLARSGKGLVTGVMDGVTGVFTKPISGAKSDGFEGFFKGIGKGAVGLVARPAAGVIDFASGSLSAVKRATELSEEVSRLRPPRYLNLDGVVRPYSHNDSEGYRILMELDKQKYASSEVFQHFESIIWHREVMLLTDNRVIYAVKNELFGGWQSDWSYKWNEIANFDINDNGVIIHIHSNGSKSKLGKIFSSGHNLKKLIHIRQNARRENLLELMRDLKSKYI